MTTKSTKHTPLPYDAHAKGLEYKKLKREYNDLQNRLCQVLAERIIAQNQRDKCIEALKVADNMLISVGCTQSCDGKGTLPSGDQCQWCDEMNKIKTILKNNSK